MSPNVFLVAIDVSGEFLGCISYKQIMPDTVEMSRLAVDSKFRGQNIGQKLIQTLLDTANENGYDSMYLETSNAQIGAIKLYEKMNFRSLRDLPLPWPILDILSGLKIKAFVRETIAIPKSKNNPLANTLNNHINPLVMSAATLRLNTDIEIQNQ